MDEQVLGNLPSVEEVEGLPFDQQVELVRGILAGVEDKEGIAALFAEGERLRWAEVAAQEFSPEGFRAFYFVIFGVWPPEHVDGWIGKIFEAIRAEKNTLIEAFRGSTKSTTVIALIAFYMGHHPERTNLVIGSGDKDAVEIVSMVANRIILHSEGWKIVFPHVVRDENGNWGENSGYDVKDTNKPYEKFIQEKSKSGRASSLIGVGYASNYLPGPHPTGMMIVDDIYNEESANSEALMIKIENIYNGTILPMKEPGTIHILIGTPWNEDDLISTKKLSNQYVRIFTPVRKPDGTPTWPEKWDAEAIHKKEEELDDPIQFARMYDLDLAKIQGMTLKKGTLRWYDHQKILKYGEDWPVFIGVDFTSTEDPTRKNVDYFALAVGKLLPGNVGVVVTDGIRVRLDQAQAEGTVVEWVSKYPYFVELGIEAVFSGRDFRNYLLNNMTLMRNNIVPTALRGGPFQRSKGYRFEKILQPAFKRAEIYLSDIYKMGFDYVQEHTRHFFETFVDEWLHWRGDKMEKLYHNDTLDAVFNLYYLASGHFDIKMMGEGREKQVTNPMRFWQDDKKKGKSNFVKSMTGRA